MLGNEQFDPPSEVATFFATKICPIDAISIGLCETISSLASGFDISNYNKTRWPIYQAHQDQSTSTKDIIHWAQLLRYQRVQKFDYGSKGNLERYNSTVPPQYNIGALTVPTILVAGGNDWLGDSRDVMWLLKTIFHTVVEVMFIDKYNHDDYVLGMDAPERVFKPVLEIMEQYRNGASLSKIDKITGSNQMDKSKNGSNIQDIAALDKIVF